MGFCISTVNFTESHLLNISIHPDHRSKGLGQVLLEESEKELNKKGVSDIFLEVRNSNIGAINFYKKIIIAMLAKGKIIIDCLMGEKTDLSSRNICICHLLRASQDFQFSFKKNY